jgi:hypothetical protein
MPCENQGAALWFLALPIGQSGSQKANRVFSHENHNLAPFSEM